MSTSVRRAWIESSVVLGNGWWIAGWIASGCGGAASSEEIETRAAELRHGVVAHVDAIAENTALERSGHSVVALDRNVYVARGVVDDFTTQTNTFPEDVWRLRTGSGVLRELAQRGDQQPGGWSYACS